MQTTPSFANQIAEAELMREKYKDTLGSITLLNSITPKIAVAGDLFLYADALGQRIVSFERRNKETANPQFLEYAMMDIETALTLDIPDWRKAKFFMRRGKINLIRGNKEGAYQDCEHAFNIALGHSAERYELLGHLAEVETELGLLRKAMVDLHEAIHQIRSIEFPEGREWHRYIIWSGLQARLTKTCIRVGWLPSAAIAFAWGYLLALWAAVWYGMPLMLGTYHDQILRRSK